VSTRCDCCEAALRGEASLTARLINALFTRAR